MTPDDDGPPTLPRGVEARRTESGLEILDFEPGTGREATSDARVKLRCVGWLTDGTSLERSGAAGRFEFRVGRGEVVPGLDEGVVGMRVGGRRRLIVPSDLAYGPRGKGGRIPPFATLIYDVELLSVG